MELKTADRFRAAISSGSYWTAEELLAVYRGEVEARWQAAASDAERVEIKTEVSTLLDWARRLTLARRSHVQTRLGRLSSQRAYGAAFGRPENIWQLQG